MNGPIAALAVAAALTAALPAAAQSHRLDAAWEAALAERGLVLDDDHFAELNLIAYHAAVARICDGFEVDVAKIADATDEVVAAGNDGLDPAQLMGRQADILIALGTAHGLFLAEGSLQRDAFCAAAEETRADPDFAHYWE